MGLDLRLLPLDHDSADWGFSHTVLDVGNASHIYDALKGVPRTAVPADFATFVSRLENGEAGYGQTQETPYGEPLQCVTVKALLKIQRSAVTKDSSAKRRAIWAYLRELDSDQRVALYWH